MRTIAHRELRNNSCEIFRALADGEEILLTNHGKPAGRIVPIDQAVPGLPVSRPRRISHGLTVIQPGRTTGTAPPLCSGAIADLE